MAEAVLSVLLNNLNSLFLEKIGLLFGINEEMKKLSSMLSTIRAVLADAEDKQFHDKAIKNWLRKLNTAALELDDILDDCATEASSNSEQQNKKSGGISSMLSCFLKPLKLNPVFRHKIGKRMKEIIEKLESIAKERNNFHLNEKPADPWRADAARSRETTSLLTEPQVYGREEDKEKIVDILVHRVSDCQDVSVLPIVGMGGLGKTTLAQLVFHDKRVVDHFHDLRWWICVSEDFDVKRLVKEIIESIEHGKSPDVSNYDVLQQHLRGLLNGKRYLLILDDVWNGDQEKWNKLKYVLACGSRGASIVTTTRIGMVAEIMGTMPAHHLSTLSEDDCWSLFKQRAFVQEAEGRPNLIKIGKEIVKKCGGLPLAANTLGGLLHFKREEHEWISVRDNEIWRLSDQDVKIMPALRLSYYHLPSKLRNCFTFCAIFQKDVEISKKEVICLWIAHGLISSDERRELEDVANEMWNELYIRSLFQDVKTKSGNVYFKIHDLVHDMAQSIVGDKYEVGSSNSIIRHGSTGEGYIYSETFPQLTILSKNLSSKYKKFPSLRVLGARCLPHDLPRGIGNLKHLRFLYLSFSEFKTLPNEIGDLYNLQILDLIFCEELLRLPHRLCSLRNLLFLNLQGCKKLEGLPKHTNKLTNLRELKFSYCISITEMPPGLGKLSSLRSLSDYIVGESKTEDCTIKELGSLNHLSGELEIRNLERVENPKDAREANLAAKENLRSLVLSWRIRDHGWSSQQQLNANEVFEALKVPPNLEVFGLSGYGGTVFPSWMSSAQVMQNVTRIFLLKCKHCKHLPPFGEFPRLKYLYLEDIPGVEYIDDDDGDEVHSDSGTSRKFQSLESLFIDSVSMLKGFFSSRRRLLEEDQFPLLRELTIRDCPGLTELPCLPSLEDLDLKDQTFSSFSGKSLPNLKYLKIEGRISLPEDMLEDLTSLKKLKITRCDVQEALPEHGLRDLISLTHLKIEECTKLKSFFEGLRYLTSLGKLWIWNCPELVSLPEAIRHVTSLHSLVIYQCQELTSFPDWLEDLTSLKSLQIYYCPKLESLQVPASLERIMTNLQQLTISGCPELHPELEKLCEKGIMRKRQYSHAYPEYELIAISS